MFVVYRPRPLKMRAFFPKLNFNFAISQLNRIFKIFCCLIVFYGLIGHRQILLAQVKINANTQRGASWQEFSTAHFQFIYPLEQAELAIRTSLAFEEAYTYLSPLLGWELMDRAKVVVDEKADYHTTHLQSSPFPLLYFNPFPPAPISIRAEHVGMDWLFIQALRQVSRLLNQDAVNGYAFYLRKIIGRPGAVPNPALSVVLNYLNAPNNFLPPWLQSAYEHYLAVEFSQNANSREALAEMVLRVASAKNNHPQLDQLNESIGGSNAGVELSEIYGPYFLNHLVHNQSIASLADFNQFTASRPPFVGIESFRDPSEKSIRELYVEFLKALDQEQQTRLAILQQQPLTPFTTLKKLGLRHEHLALSKDERLLAMQTFHGDQGYQLWLMDLKTKKSQKLLAREITSLAWHPTGQALFFTAPELQNGTLYHNLFVYDLHRRELYPVTDKTFYADVAIRPDGKALVVVATDQKQQNLIQYTLQSFPQGPLIYEAPFQLHDKRNLTHLQNTRLAQPSWSHAGDRLAFNQVDNLGKAQLIVMAAEKAEVLLSWSSGTAQAYPVWEFGDQAILYSANVNGVYNLYRFQLSRGHYAPVTHVLGGAFQSLAATKSQKLYFQIYRGKGLEIAEIPWQPGQERSQALPVIQSSYISSSKHKQQNPRALTSFEPMIEKAYSPFSDMWPYFIIPYAERDVTGYAWGVVAAGTDALQQQSYFIEVLKGAQEQIYHRFNYQNLQWTPLFTLSSQQLPKPYPHGLGLPRAWEKVHEVQLKVTHEILQKWQLSAALLQRLQVPLKSEDFAAKVAAHQQFLGSEADYSLYPDEQDYYRKHTFVGKRAGFKIGLAYDSTYHYPLSISEVGGQQITLNYLQFPASWGRHTPIKIIKGKLLDKELASLKQNDPLFNPEQLTPLRLAALQSRLIALEKTLSHEYSMISGSFTDYIALPWRRQALKFSIHGGSSLNGNVIAQEFQTGSSIPIRGYRHDSEGAEKFLAHTLEWRFPLLDIFRGWGTLPMFYKQLHAAIFFDYAVLSGGFGQSDFFLEQQAYVLRDYFPDQIRRSYGLEIKLLSHLGFMYPLNLVGRVSKAIDINLIPGINRKNGTLAELELETTF